MSASDNHVSNGGWFSAVGRLFAGAGSSEDSERRVLPAVAPGLSPSASRVADNPQEETNGEMVTSNARGLRYLSPSALDMRTKLDTTRHEPSKDIFFEATTRKRLLKPASPSHEPLSQGLAKRFRGLVNHSMIEEPSRVTVANRLDTTWSGGIASFMHPTSSPASSIRSLRSRVSDFSTSTGLSSKTRNILQQLERVSTPSKDAKKLPTMRGGGTGTEKWAALNTSLGSGPATSDPPLRKTMGAVPSRAQLLSSSIGANRRKPYWRDIVRKPKVTVSDDIPTPGDSQTNSALEADMNGSMLHPLFDMGASPKKSSNTLNSNLSSIVKGVDGKSRNKFSALELEETDFVNQAPLPMISLPVPLSGAPPTGFIDDVVFTFAAPKERKLGDSEQTLVESDSSVSSDDQSRENSNNDSSSDHDDSGSDSEEGDSKSVNGAKGREESRPPTSTDSETSATPASSKNQSPLLNQAKDKEPAEESWDCSECCVPNTGPECVCCGHKKGGVAGAQPAQKTLVSNISSFASSKPPTGVSFGFGGSVATSTTNFSGAAPVSSTMAPSFGFGTSTLQPKKSETNGTIDTDTAASSVAELGSPKENRVDWTCPDCFINNKSTDDKCCACSHVMYKSAGGNTSSVFGDRAFKPVANTDTTVTFGLGSKDASSATVDKRPLFGFGAASQSLAAPTLGNSADSLKASTSTNVFAPEATKAPPAGTTGTTTLFGSVITSSTPAATLFGAPTPVTAPVLKQPIFGASTTVAASKGDETSIITSPTQSLFGSSATSLKSSTAPLSFTTPSSSTATIGQLGSIFDKPASTTASVAAPILSFGAAASTTTSVAAPILSFGAAPSATISTGLSTFGSSSDKNLFGAATATSAAPERSDEEAPSAKKMFSSTAPTENKTAFSFGSSGNSATNGFGASSSTGAPVFGSSNSTPSFGVFNKPASTAPAPVLSNSSSTSSLFNAPAAPPKPFDFGAPQPPVSGAFNFGGGAATINSNAAFVFGQPSTTTAPAGPSATGSFAFGSAPVAAPVPSFSIGSGVSDAAQAGGAFAFGASSGGGPSARKMANARRRMPTRRP